MLNRSRHPPGSTARTYSAPPENCGGIWAFNEFSAGLNDNTFDAGEVTAQLTGLAEVLVPAPEFGSRKLYPGKKIMRL